MNSLSLFRFLPFVAFFSREETHRGSWRTALRAPSSGAAGLRGGSAAGGGAGGLQGVPACGRDACIIPELVYNCWNMMIIKNQFYRLCDDFSILHRQCIPLLLVPQDARHLLTG